MSVSDSSPAQRGVTREMARDMANAIRALAMDAVEAANSGHPGMPMGMADVATVLFTRFLKFSAADPAWPDRDRFVLSAGHGSMLLYSLLHLTGYAAMTMDDLRRFRQLDSRTPGHPEFGAAPGIETTTGPLGQGLANAVGMAIAERHLAATFGADLVDHFTYVIAGDGCLMEGISQEALSLAGHLRLGRLIVLFDDNQISIDGPTSLSTSEDMLARFKASGWHVQAADGHNQDAVAAAIEAARTAPEPSLIACRTIIGYGAPTKQGTSATHGSPLGAKEVAGAREKLGWSAPPFEIPAPIAAAWREAGKRSETARTAWNERLQRSSQRAEFERRLAGTLPAAAAEAFAALKTELVAAAAKPDKTATRRASQIALEKLVPAMPELLGGSADLTGSNLTLVKGMQPLTRDHYAGRYIYYGIREHGMAAAMNGAALHGGVIPYGGTFLAFTDYMRPALRLSALMRQRVVYVMTHDSIGLGEDGPTHQPVEHLAALRAIPHLLVMRPADVIETAECWELALGQADRPSVLALSRQGVPPLRKDAAENRSAKGAYELSPASGKARVTLIATGTEVAIALAAQAQLAGQGIATRVVSMPCQELFDEQPADYRRATLAPDTLRVAIEAASGFGWERYTGENGLFVGMTDFGASAPAEVLYEHFGITPKKIAERVRERVR